MMRRILFPLISIAAGLLLFPAAMFAADELEPIVRKDTLSASDRARIETIVGQRVKKMLEAAEKPKALRDARDTLIATARVDKATPAGLEAYASACADALATPVTHEKLGLSLEAVQVLLAIDQPKVAEALAGGLRSSHAAVRYRVAAGLKGLEKRIATDSVVCRSILGALGRAGAGETNEFALRAIYEAINIKSAAPAFKGGDEMANALLEVFSSRLNSLAQIGRDEWKDIPGFEAAAACFKDASESKKKELVRCMYQFLNNAADRYSADGTTAEYVPTLVATTRAAEEALSQMVREGGADPITISISSNMHSKQATANKKAVNDGLTALKAALARTPWPVS